MLIWSKFALETYSNTEVLAINQDAVQPGAKGGYYYVWQVEKKGLDADNCRVEFAGKSLTLGQDYYLSGFGVTAAREARDR